LENREQDMAQIRDIMEKNVITIEHDKTALDAARLISEKDVSFLVIMKNNIPIGVLSESDFVKRLAVNDRKASEVDISKIMSSKFRWVEPETEIEDAIQKMLNNNIRRLIILDNNKLAGVVTQTDLTEFLRNKLLVDKTIKNI
jgi:CBS domain-containing protein